jgi:arabinan endo-1,5-alpha-L-arabinosidase
MELRLVTPDGAPYQYEITVSHLTTPEAGESELSVSAAPDMAPAVESKSASAARYRFRRNDHSSYLDLFDRLASDFGLRRPLNRRPTTRPSFEQAFEPLLTHNLAGIKYGYGDPAVIRVEQWSHQRYYMTCTSNDAPDSFPILRSGDLRRWEHVGYIFPRGQKPAWCLDGEGIADYWAPELHIFNGQVHAYFAARHRDTRELCIGVASAPHPEGPFTPAPEPLLKNEAIDPHVLVDADGAAYLYWKEDSNGVWPMRLSGLLHRFPKLIAHLFRRDADRRTASFAATLFPWLQTLQPMEQFLAAQNLIESVTSRFSDFEERLAECVDGSADSQAHVMAQDVLSHLKTKVFVCALSADGLSLAGEPVKILENDQPWEGHVVEGIWVHKHGDRYFMFYAGNDFSTAEYAINAATSRSPYGPFVKSATPFLKSTREWSGPGHPSVAIGPDGNHMLFVHAYRPGHEGYKQFRAFLGMPFVVDGVSPRPLN